MGRAALLAQWRDVLAEAETSALLEPARTYPGARTFWRAARAVCVHLDHVGVPVLDRALWAALLATLDQPEDDHAHRNAGILPTALLTAERVAALKLRAMDGALAAPPVHYPRVATTDRLYPRSTIGDVVTLAIRWNDRLATAMRDHPGALVTAATEWHRIVDDVTATTRGVAADQPYAHAHAFWDALVVLAMAMDKVVDPVAYARLMVPEGNAALSLAESIRDELSGITGGLVGGAEAVGGTVASIIEGLGHGAGELLGDVAKGAGKIAGGAARGFLDPFVMPLAIGGGVLAVYLLTRDRGEHAETGAA